MRWLPGFHEALLETLSLPTGARLAYDIKQNPVILFPTDWSANYFAQTNPKVTLASLPVDK